MTLDERGYTTCTHPAMRLRRGRTRPNCEMCGALKTPTGWIGGSTKFVFDVQQVYRRHGARIAQEQAH